ncbi:MAG: hypothetical protein AAF829_06020 [Pseudomonadota bacterium]
MRYLFVSLAAIAGLALFSVGIRIGVPAYLATGTPLGAEPADFTVDAGWIKRPETRPDAVWEGGWALDFFVLPPVPDTLQRHGSVSTDAGKAHTAVFSQTTDLVSLLEAHGAVYMPALRMPSQVTAAPDWEMTRSDLVSALSVYTNSDNRGRAMVFVADASTWWLVQSLSDILSAAGSPDVEDRVVLVMSPTVLAQPDHSMSNAQYHSLNMHAAKGFLQHLLAMPQKAPTWQLPENTPESDNRIQSLVQDALERATQTSAKAVEPFGAIEIIREAPINRPCEAGLRCGRD